LLNVSTTEQAWASEYEIRLRAMEAAIARLDAEGLFGSGPDRLRIVVNVEVMPPDYTNTVRAQRLNPQEALTTWLHEASERAPDNQRRRPDA